MPWPTDYERRLQVAIDAAFAGLKIPEPKPKWNMRTAPSQWAEFVEAMGGDAEQARRAVELIGELVDPADVYGDDYWVEAAEAADWIDPNFEPADQKSEWDFR